MCRWRRAREAIRSLHGQLRRQHPDEGVFALAWSWNDSFNSQLHENRISTSILCPKKQKSKPSLRSLFLAYAKVPQLWSKRKIWRFSTPKARSNIPWFPEHVELMLCDDEELQGQNLDVRCSGIRNYYLWIFAYSSFGCRHIEFKQW